MIDDLLTEAEMVRLNAALDLRTSGRVKVGPEPLTLAEARALWLSVRGSIFAVAAPSKRKGSVQGHWVPVARTRRLAFRSSASHTSLVRKVGLGATAGALVSLAGCATLGGNVKGSFACAAPDGMCAPTSKIDDQALAMIQGDVAVTPAGPYEQPGGEAHMLRTASPGLARTREKVVRIVFPSHVDGQGRYVEQSAIHAVVERASWAGDLQDRDAPVRTSLNAAMPSLGELAAAAPEEGFASLPSESQMAMIDPEMPSQAAINAARAKLTTPRASTVTPGIRAISVPASTTSSFATAPVVVPSVGAVSPSAVTSPLDGIRAAVSASLTKARIEAPTSIAIPSSANLRPASPAAKTTSPQLPASSTKPVNGPALFPASDIGSDK